MSQLFGRRTQLLVKLGLLALAGALLLAAGLWVWRARAYAPQGEPVAQVIPFSHKHHVGDDGIDCRYCHTTVETSAYAGLPSTQVCLSCHSQLYTDQQVLAPLMQSAATGVPIPWRRVHQLPDFVYFNHSVHVNKGVACAECHGRIDQMPLTWRARALEMRGAWRATATRSRTCTRRTPCSRWTRRRCSEATASAWHARCGCTTRGA